MILEQTNELQIFRRMERISAHDFYNKVLGNPKFIVAPMVEQSELPGEFLADDTVHIVLHTNDKCKGFSG